MKSVCALFLGIQILSLLENFQCDCSNTVERCYKTVENQHVCFWTLKRRDEYFITWKDANGICHDRSSTLPLFLSSTIETSFEQFISYANVSNDEIWLAGKRQYLGGWQWLDGRTETYVQVNSKYSDIGGGTHATIAYDGSSTSYIEANAIQNNNYICEYQGGHTPDDQSPICYGSRCYVFYQSPVDWFTARNRCLMTSGGDLTTSNLTTLQHVLTDAKVDRNTGWNFWVGLRKYSWKWQDENTTEIKLTNWANNQPSAINNSSPPDICMTKFLQGNWNFYRHCDTDKEIVICQTVTNLNSTHTNPPSEATQFCLESLPFGLVVGFAVAFSIITHIIIGYCCYRYSSRQDQSKASKNSPLKGQNSYCPEPSKGNKSKTLPSPDSIDGQHSVNPAYRNDYDNGEEYSEITIGDDVYMNESEAHQSTLSVYRRC